MSAAQLERGYRLVELLKQSLNSPMPVEEQVVAIYAGTSGHLDDLPVEDVQRFEAELLEYVRTTHSGMLAEIKSGPVPDNLGDVIDQFKDTFTVSDASQHVDPTATDADEMGDAESNKTLATE